MSEDKDVKSKKDVKPVKPDVLTDAAQNEADEKELAEFKKQAEREAMLVVRKEMILKDARNAIERGIAFEKFNSEPLNKLAVAKAKKSVNKRFTPPCFADARGDR